MLITYPASWSLAAQKARPRGKDMSGQLSERSAGKEQQAVPVPGGGSGHSL